MSSANPPSVDVKNMLIATGAPLATYVLGTNIFVGSLQDSPNDCVCVLDTGGSGQGQFGHEYPNVQILIRNLDYTTGYSLARDIKYHLHEARDNETWGGVRYISISCRSDILPMGQDTKNRYLFSINFQAQRSGI